MSETRGHALPDDDVALGEALAGAGHVVPSGPGGEVGSDVDLTVGWMGMRLRSPVVASSSPLTGSIESLRALDAAGVGAVVLPSLFEEQLDHEVDDVDRYLGRLADANPEATYGYAPVLDDYNHGVEEYLGLIRAAKDAVGMPVVASLNGDTPGGWTSFARLIVDAGADAIELNVHRVVADATRSAPSIEAETVEVVSAVAAACEVPIAVKLGPFFTSLPNLAQHLVDAGAQGLSLFNRFYVPDVDLEALRVERHLQLSSSTELGHPLRWIGILHGRVDASLAATTGVHTAQDALKALLVGADVTMMASALLRNGAAHAGTVVDGIRGWMTQRGYASVEQLSGSMSQAVVADPSAFERANYIDTLTRFANTFRR